MDIVQFTMQIVNLFISLVGVYYWFGIGRLSRQLDTISWWPIALLVNNSLFSVASMIWLLHDLGFYKEPFSPIFLNYWGQAVRIQLGITLVYGAWVADRILRRRVIT